mmetsp:Transcript_33921/g.52855  ORF Transcript_33921/g.52855 Transcript_33921/m.52855 type:complete len:496 (-) Transcript_33921:61-1548(-)
MAHAGEEAPQSSSQTAWELEMWKKVMDEAQGSSEGGLDEDTRGLWHQILVNAEKSNLKLWKEPDSPLSQAPSRPESWSGSSSFMNSPSNDSSCSSRPLSVYSAPSRAGSSAPSRASSSAPSRASSSAASRTSSSSTMSSGVLSQAETVRGSWRGSEAGWQVGPFKTNSAGFDRSESSCLEGQQLSRASSEAVRGTPGVASEGMWHITRPASISVGQRCSPTKFQSPMGAEAEAASSSSSVYSINPPLQDCSRSSSASSLYSSAEGEAHFPMRRARSEVPNVSPTRKYGYRLRVMRRMSSVPASSDESGDEKRDDGSSPSSSVILQLPETGSSSHSEMRRRARKAAIMRRKSTATDVEGNELIRSHSAIAQSKSEKVAPAVRRVSSDSVLPPHLVGMQNQVSGAQLKKLLFLDPECLDRRTSTASQALGAEGEKQGMQVGKQLRRCLFLDFQSTDPFDLCLAVIVLFCLICTVLAIAYMPASSRVAGSVQPQRLKA